MLMSAKDLRTGALFLAETTVKGVRLDAAWGYDTGEISKKPIIYFSLGTDF